MASDRMTSFSLGVAAARRPPRDQLLGGGDRRLGIGSRAGPVRRPVRGGGEGSWWCRTCRAAAPASCRRRASATPPARRRGARPQLVIGAGLRGEHHRQLVRVGTDRLAARSSACLTLEVPGEAVAQPLHQRGDAPALPQEAVAPPRAEITEPQRPLLRQHAETLDLVPQLGLGAGVEEIELEPAHLAHGRAGPEFRDDGETRHLPHRGLRHGPSNRSSNWPSRSVSS